MESALLAKPDDVGEQYERRLKDPQEACGEAMMELRARKMAAPIWQVRELILSIREGFKGDREGPVARLCNSYGLKQEFITYTARSRTA